ncbi:zinc-regulated TonB-dependent outer membrane receptor [Hyalangium sp.]|uniref:zinc-regulated TonB-dependent outer membrane receptor n=1 Tax=Hyalangium sp. TaxID=2028555 RepID=UPI002D306A5C|nr:zinc-regulated TonB-dependent outer membrane receptor [Hyalangium sp.]HYH94688.1 zinc-regulated TonB-dependent outer membrane receptor [Hyalangium sp.]
MFPRSRQSPGIIALVPCLLLYALPASAQQAPPDASTPPADASTPPAEGAPTDPAIADDLAEIEAALGKDKAEAGTGTPAEAPASSGSGSVPTVVRVGSNNQWLDLSFVLDAALAAFTAEEPLQSGGHDPNTNGFNFQQLELSVRSVVDPYFRFDANIVFALAGVEIEEVYVTTLDLPANLQLRAGQFLTRFGRINPTHPHAWDFADQAFAVGRVFGGEGNRGLGLEVSWLTPLPWYVELVGSTTDATGEGTARSFLGGGGGRVVSPLDFQFTGAVKQFFALSDDLSLLWGLSSATGPNPTGYRNFTNVFGTDVYLKYRPTTVASNTIISLQAELLYRRRQVPDDVLSDYNGYAQVLWRFAKRWATAARYEFGTAAHDQDGRLANDPLDPEWTETRQRISASVTFWPTEFSRLRLQAATDRAGWRDERDYSAFLTLEAVVGAHGSHAF